MKETTDFKYFIFQIVYTSQFDKQNRII